MASVIGYNTLLVSELQSDPDPAIAFTFEQASWICEAPPPPSLPAIPPQPPSGR
jgi:hypothetical protein